MEGENEDQGLVIPNNSSFPHQPYPWLLIYDGADEERQTFYSITDDRYIFWPIAQLHRKYICGCYNEWLVLQDAFWTSHLYLLNTLTMGNIELPQLNVSGYYWFCVFSSPPTDSNCYILFVVGGYKYHKCIIGHDEPEIVTGKFTLDRDIWTITTGINFEGKLHALIGPQFDLVMADFSDPDLHFTTVIRGEPLVEFLLGHEPGTYALVESCGELLFELVDIRIFRADFSAKVWVKVENLGDRTIFVQPYCTSLSCVRASSFGLRGNCVYIVKGCDRNLYIYDMEDQSILMSLPCSIVSSESLCIL